MNDHNQNWQRAILHHPAIRREGVDPLWRVIAIIGWITVGIMTAISVSK